MHGKSIQIQIPSSVALNTFSEKSHPLETMCLAEEQPNESECAELKQNPEWKQEAEIRMSSLADWEHDNYDEFYRQYPSTAYETGESHATYMEAEGNMQPLRILHTLHTLHTTEGRDDDSDDELCDSRELDSSAGSDECSDGDDVLGGPTPWIDMGAHPKQALLQSREFRTLLGGVESELGDDPNDWYCDGKKNGCKRPDKDRVYLQYDACYEFADGRTLCEVCHAHDGRREEDEEDEEPAMQPPRHRRKKEDVVVESEEEEEEQEKRAKKRREAVNDVTPCPTPACGSFCINHVRGCTNIAAAQNNWRPFHGRDRCSRCGLYWWRHDKKKEWCSDVRRGGAR